MEAEDLTGYAEMADPAVLAALAWDGMRRTLGRPGMSYTEAEVKFYIQYTKGQLTDQDASVTPNFL